MLVIKRDGREVLFEPEKIYNAILKAFKNPKYTDQDKHLAVSTILQTVLRAIPVSEKIGIESIQDVVEQALIKNNYPEEAKEYILYRQHRSNIRNSKNRLMKTVHDIIHIDAEDMDEKRENANIDGNTTFGAMLKIGEAFVKNMMFTDYEKPEYVHLHESGAWHEHDLGESVLCWNCLSIPLDKLFKKGFSTGHGFIRPPQTIFSAATLMCVVIQSNQSDMYKHHCTF